MTIAMVRATTCFFPLGELHSLHGPLVKTIDAHPGQGYPPASKETLRGEGRRWHKWKRLCRQPRTHERKKKGE